MAASTPTVPFSVEGKAAILTGAGSGITLEFARLLLQRRCSVLIADLSLRPEAQALIAQYSHSTTDNNNNDDASFPRALFLRTDVTKWAQLEAMFAFAISAFGSVDIVCPGAGVYEPHWSNFWHPPGSTLSLDAPDHGDRYKLYDINLIHPVRVTQLAIAHFLNPPPGKGGRRASATNPKRVLHIGSIAGQVANLHAPLYNSGKFAITGLVRSLAGLEGVGVRVNAVAPGLIRTPLWTEHPEKMKFVGENDLWATAEETAAAMLRCVLDEGLVGGTVLEVGAGQTRVVKPFNDPGPSGAGHTASAPTVATAEVLQWLGEPGWGTRKESKL